MSVFIALLKQVTEFKPGDSSVVGAEEASRMLTEVQRMLKEMKANNCTTHTGTAANEQEMSRKRKRNGFLMV